MTAQAIIAIVIAVVAIGAAFMFFLQYSALAKGEADRRQVAEDAAARAKKLQTEYESAKEELARKRTEASDLREKLNDIRQKQFKKDKGAKPGVDAGEVDAAKQQAEDAASRVDVL